MRTDATSSRPSYFVQSLKITVVSVAILASSLGVAGLALPPRVMNPWLIHAIGTIGHRGCLGFMTLGPSLGGVAVLYFLRNRWEAKRREKANQAFVEAAREKDFDKLKKLLTSEIDINARDPQRRTALHYAAMNPQTQMLFFLLEQEGIDPNAQDAVLFTPLHYAARDGRKESVERLLQCNTIQKDGASKSGLTTKQLAERGEHGATAALFP